MSTEPAACAGRVSLSCVLDTLVKATLVPPAVTRVTSPRLAPVTVTVVTAVVAPLAGLSEVSAGTGGLTKVSRSASLVALVPAGPVTVTCTGPAVAAAGVTNDSVVGDKTLTPVPASAPAFTAVAPVKLAPVTVTVVPPRVETLATLSRVTTGAGALYVNVAAGPAALVPDELVTVTFTVSPACAGLVATSWVRSEE